MNIILAIIGLGVPVVLLSLLLTSLMNNKFVEICKRYLKFNKTYQYITLYLILLVVLILSISLPFRWKTTTRNTYLAEQNVVSVSDTLTKQNNITVKTENDDIDINIMEPEVSITLIADVIEHPENYKIVYYKDRTGFVVFNKPVIEKRYEVTT